MTPNHMTLTPLTGVLLLDRMQLQAAHSQVTLKSGQLCWESKMEYLEEFGFELLQADELSRWWAAASLPPPGSCDVVVSPQI